MTDLAINWLAAIFKASCHGSLAVASIWIVGRLHPGLAPKTKMWLLRLAYLVFLTDLSMPALSVSILPALPALPIPLPQPMDASGGASFLQGHTGILAVTLMSVWILCVTGLLVKMACTVAVSVRTSRRWTPMTEEHGQRAVHWICRRICTRMGIARIPRLSTCQEGGPALVGFINPVVMVPTAVLNDCDQRELELVLAHELAHLRKGDLVWCFLSAIVDALFFFIPPLRWASRELKMAQEMDADTIAISVTESEPSIYGTLLVRLSVDNMRPAGELLTAAMSSFEFLKMRLVHLTNEGRTNLMSRVISLVLGVFITLAALPVEFTARTVPMASTGLPSIGNGTFVYSYIDDSGRRLFLKTNHAMPSRTDNTFTKKVLVRFPAAGAGKRLFLVKNDVVYKVED